MTQVTSEKQYLEKANRHLENILEATHAHKNQEVSELNRIHVETIKVSEPRKLCLSLPIRSNEISLVKQLFILFT